MTEPSAATARLVRQRASDRCEYCLMHQSLQVATYHIEHIIPACAGGLSSPDNLALACPTCNLHKADRLSADDPETGEAVPLFHPRLHVWTEHFRWSAYEVIGKTPIGRAAIGVLHLNHERRIKVRVAEDAFGLFPPLGSS